MAINICGDWNLIIDPELDCENYKHVNNPKARAVVKDSLDGLEFMDAYRLINEEKKDFTWRKLNPDKKTSQTGFFYTPNFKKVGDILVSAYPYVCVYSCSRYRLETSCMDSSWKNS